METWEYVVRELCCVPTFLWLALQDKRYLGITRKGLVISSAVLLLGGWFGTVSWQSRIGGAMMGVVLLVFAYFSREAIGIADGVIILVSGVAFGLYETVVLCFMAALYAGAVSGVLLLVKKAGRKTRIPFLPFLLLGYVTMRAIMSSV